MLRVDRSVVPTMMKGATLSAGELELAPARRERRASRSRGADRPRRDRARARHHSDESRTPARALRDARAERPPTRADLHRRHHHAPGGVAGQLVHVVGVHRLRRGERSDDCREERSVPSQPVAADARSTSCVRSCWGSRPSWRGRTQTSRPGSTRRDSISWAASSITPIRRQVRALQGRFLAALFPALDNLEQPGRTCLRCRTRPDLPDCRRVTGRTATPSKYLFSSARRARRAR